MSRDGDRRDPSGDPAAGNGAARAEGAGAEGSDAEGGGAEPETGRGLNVTHAQRVNVRRARPAGTVFGDTPIAGPPRPDDSEVDEDEPGEEVDLAAWVRKAALVAALRSGAQACVTGVFMGIVLGFFLTGLLPGVALLLGLALCLGSVPVSVLAGWATYRQTLESERQRQGLCPRCGYDLRGLNTARCPECGAKLRAPKAWLAESDRNVDDEDQ